MSVKWTRFWPAEETQMRNRYIVLLLLIILVAGANELAAQMGTGRVAGTIKDDEGNPIEGAKVVAQMSGSDFQLEATTDGKGRWAILGFRKGGYQFTFSARGYIPQQFTSQISGIGKNPNMNVQLEKMSSGQAFATGPAAEYLKEAAELYEQKQFPQALEKLNLIVTEFPDLYQMHLNIGNCYREMGEPEKAMEHYNMVLAEEPEHTGALVNVGDMKVRSGDLEGAVTYFEKAITQAPDDEVLPFNVAEIYFDQGNVDKAIEYYQRASEVRPDWPEPYLKIGYAYINNADMENAATAFNKVIEVAPDTPQAAMAQAALDSIQQ
jgi:tetratricopeptide (TPR) repeat protein